MDILSFIAVIFDAVMLSFTFMCHRNKKDVFRPHVLQTQ